MWFFFKSRKAHREKIPSKLINRIDHDALLIVERLQKKGIQSYLVGGCVRDLLLGNTPKDFDIATNGTPNKVKALIRRSQIIGRRFKIVIAFRPAQRKDFQKKYNPLIPVIRKKMLRKEFEITTFRRKPEKTKEGTNENVFGTAREDALRRDFTLNGLFLDPHRKEIIDYVGGCADLKKGLIRVIGNPKKRFEEDPIRILRALRFKAKTHLNFEKKTEQALKKCAPCIKEAKRERLREEILKIWREGMGFNCFPLLSAYNIWEHAFPGTYQSILKQDTFEKDLLKLGKATEKHNWPNQRLNAPFFYFMIFPPSKELSKGIPKYSHLLFDDFRVSRVEKDYITSIHNKILFLQRTHNYSGLHLKKGNLESWAQLSYILQIMAECKAPAYSKLWKEFQPHWKKALKSQEI